MLSGFHDFPRSRSFRPLTGIFISERQKDGVILEARASFRPLTGIFISEPLPPEVLVITGFPEAFAAQSVISNEIQTKVPLKYAAAVAMTAAALTALIWFQ